MLELSTTPAGLRRGLELTAPDGICTSAGGLHGDAKIPYGLMFARNVDAEDRPLPRPRRNARRARPDRLRPDRPGAGQLDLGSIDDAPRALRDHAEGNAIKTVLLES